MREAHLPAQHHHPQEASRLPRQGEEAGRAARAAAEAPQRALEYLSLNAINSPQQGVRHTLLWLCMLHDSSK